MQDSTTTQLNVLVVGEALDQAGSLLQELGDRVSVQTASSVQEAEFIRERSPVDVVLVTPDALKTYQLHQSAHSVDPAIEHASQGVCVVDNDGEFVWASPKMLKFPESIQKRVGELCREAISWATEGEFDLPSHLRGRHFTVDDEGLTFEVHVTPVTDKEHNVIQVSAVVWDATQQRRLQRKLVAINKAAKELVSLDVDQIGKLDTQERLDVLEEKIIKYTHDLMNFDSFTVHLLDHKTNRLELVLSTGMPSKVNEIPIFARPDGNGICGFVAAHGKSYLCPDTSKDSRYITGIESGKSSLSVPLLLHDTVIGVFNVESDRIAAFSEDDRQFAEIFGGHIAIAIHILNLLDSERHKTTGRLQGDVSEEISGPLNDMLTDVATLIDDYIGHDELRARLNEISDNGARVRDGLKAMTEQQPGVIDRRRSRKSVRHDPVLEGRSILVVDDEEIIRDTVSDVLKGFGCDVRSAQDGDVAIQMLGEGSFDLVLSDIKMPNNNGYEVFAAAKERDAKCPVILMTGFGYDPNHSIVRARREGLAAVLFKPFKVEQLLGEIRTAIKSATSKS
ncbi:MAG: two-component system response regulator [Phycisphaerae bacterium]|nr:MAG: two-component system response regulator [Phycisphaerae bacterium]